VEPGCEAACNVMTITLLEPPLRTVSNKALTLMTG
jgi:hypothetical protein